MLNGLEKLYTGTLGEPAEVWAELNTIPQSLGGEFLNILTLLTLNLEHHRTSLIMADHQKKGPVNANNWGSILSKGVVGVGRAGDCQPVSGTTCSNLPEEIRSGKGTMRA